MKSVLYCGCTVNAYMPCTPVRLSLSLFSRIQLFRSDSLFLSFSLSSWPVVSSSLFARYLARWAPAQPMKARGGELLRRSYGMAGIAGGGGRCLRNVLIVSATPSTPFAATTLLVPLHEFTPSSQRRGTVLRILMDRLRNCWRN